MPLDKSKYGKKMNELGFWQITPTPTKDELEAYYKDVYYQECPADTYSKSYPAEELQYIKNRAVVSEKIWKDFGRKEKGDIFDVGCGEGFWVNYFLEKGWCVEACDFSSFGVSHFNPKVIPFFERGDVYDILMNRVKQSRKYDFINLANILEHVVDPAKMVRLLRELLHKDSLLKINVPNDYSEFQQLLKDQGKITDEYWFAPPDHLNYFTFDSLKKFLEAYGYGVFLMHSDFPIELFVMNDHSNYAKDKSKGKQAHMSRLIVDNFLFKRDIEGYLQYMVSAAKLGFGRSIIAYVYLK